MKLLNFDFMRLHEIEKIEISCALDIESPPN